MSAESVQKLLYRIRILRVCFIYNEKCINRLAYSFVLIHLLLCSFLQLHILYEVESIDALIHQSYWPIAFFSFPSFSYLVRKWVNRFADSFFTFTYFIFFFFILIFDMKLTSKTICLFLFLHSSISFLLLQLHIRYEVKWIDLLIHFLTFIYSISSSSFSYSIWSWLP